MSAAAASGSGGMDGDDDKKRKRALPVDAPDVFSESSDDESATIEKPKGLSPHCPGKSKSFDDLTKLGNMRTEEIVKKEKTKYKKRRIEMHREAGEAKKKLENTIGRLAGATLDLEEDEKATEEEAEDAEKSIGGASGSESDHYMAEAGSSGEIAKTDDMVRDEQNGGKK